MQNSLTFALNKRNRITTAIVWIGINKKVMYDYHFLSIYLSTTITNLFFGQLSLIMFEVSHVLLRFWVVSQRTILMILQIVI